MRENDTRGDRARESRCPKNGGESSRCYWAS